MRQWTNTGGASSIRRLKSPLSSPIMTPSSSIGINSNVSSSNTSAFLSAGDLVVQSDDLSPFPAEWYHAAALYPFQPPPQSHQQPVTQQLQHLHLESQQQQFQPVMSQDESFQQISAPIVPTSSDAGAVGFHCPICLRAAAQAPIRQACGHALCFHCTQQAISMFGSCPLCRTQLIFGGSSSSSNSNNGRSLNGGGASAANPVGGGGGGDGVMELGFALGQSRIPLHHHQQQQQFEDAYLAHEDQDPEDFQPQVGVASPMPFDGNGGAAARDLHSDVASELSLQLDSLSDFGDMIDLPDLVASSDSEPQRSRHPVVVGPAVGLVAVRKARAPRKKAQVIGAAVEHQPLRRGNAGSSSNPPAAIGKKRKRKAPELVDESLVWALVDVEGEIPAQRYDCGFAVFETNLIVVGGIVGNHRLNDLYILETQQHHRHSPARWKKPLCTGTPPPTGSLLQTFVIGETLYVLGGTNDGKFLNELHAMNLKSGEWKWERLAIAGQPPSMRYWYSVSVLDGIAILYGGYGHPKRLGDTFALRFDTEMPTWMELQPSGDLPGPSSTHSVCVHDSKMYIFGGYDGKSRRSQLHALSIVSKTHGAIECVWEQVVTLGRGPAPRYTHSSASIGSRMLVYGGNSGCLKGDLYILEFDDVELPTWKVVKCEHAPPPREWHRAVVLDDAMFVFGGHTAEGNENKLYKLTTKELSLSPSTAP